MATVLDVAFQKHTECHISLVKMNRHYRFNQTWSIYDHYGYISGKTDK